MTVYLVQHYTFIANLRGPQKKPRYSGRNSLYVYSEFANTAHVRPDHESNLVRIENIIRTVVCNLWKFLSLHSSTLLLLTTARSLSIAPVSSFKAIQPPSIRFKTVVS